MTYWMNYAFISQNKVQNICVFEPNGSYTMANMHAKEFCNDANAFAVEANQYPVAIGDKYIDGSFYRNDILIERLPTDEEEIRIHDAKIEEASESIDDLWVAVLEG